MLKYDDEYISTIFKALPTSERTEWLKYSKEEFEWDWEALLKFLDEAQERATNTKAHLTNYAAQGSSSDEMRCRKCNRKGHIKKDCIVGATNIKRYPEDSDVEIDVKR